MTLKENTYVNYKGEKLFSLDGHGINARKGWYLPHTLTPTQSNWRVFREKLTELGKFFLFVIGLLILFLFLFFLAIK